MWSCLFLEKSQTRLRRRLDQLTNSEMKARSCFINTYTDSISDSAPMQRLTAFEVALRKYSKDYCTRQCWEMTPIAEFARLFRLHLKALSTCPRFANKCSNVGVLHVYKRMAVSSITTLLSPFQVLDSCIPWESAHFWHSA
jgi:hypothetical protein